MIEYVATKAAILSKNLVLAIVVAAAEWLSWAADLFSWLTSWLA